MKRLITILSIILTVSCVTNDVTQGNFYERMPLDGPAESAVFVGELFEGGDFASFFFVLSNRSRNLMYYYFQSYQFDRLVPPDLVDEATDAIDADDTSEHGSTSIAFILDNVFAVCHKKGRFLFDLRGIEPVDFDSALSDQTDRVSMKVRNNNSVEFKLVWVKAPSGKWRLDNVFQDTQVWFTE